MQAEKLKTCGKCEEAKPLAEFFVARTSRHLHGRAAICKDCSSVYQKEYRVLNYDRVIKRDREYNRKNSSRRVKLHREKGYNKKYYHKHQIKELERHERYNQQDGTRGVRWRAYLKRQYGITHEDYELLLKTQDSKCAICRRAPLDGVTLHIDHDHVTLKIRGILCGSCNRLIGIAGESISRLKAAIYYIQTRVLA